jgi:two-component system, sensor histidine kinase
MDGVSATIALKEKYSDLPPIAGLSANAFEGDRGKYMALGMDEYLTKPLNKEDFVRLLKMLFKTT